MAVSVTHGRKVKVELPARHSVTLRFVTRLFKAFLPQNFAVALSMKNLALKVHLRIAKSFFLKETATIPGHSYGNSHEDYYVLECSDVV